MVWVHCKSLAASNKNTEKYLYQPIFLPLLVHWAKKALCFVHQYNATSVTELCNKTDYRLCFKALAILQK